MKSLYDLGVIIIITLVLLESALRIQQYFGPLYDLEYETINLEGLSNTTNHKPLRHNVLKLSGASIYGKFDGFEYTTCFNELGIRENRLRPKSNSDNDGISILFMGDSFMEGYDDSNTIPQHVWVYFKKNGLTTHIYNAGQYSYSPAIFIPQAKHIVPQLHPDFIVVDIDETDLGDDYIRYKELIVRNDQGKIIGVQYTPLNYEYLSGFIKIKKQPFFLVKYLQSLYHTKIYMPDYKKKYRKDTRDVLCFSYDMRINAKEIYSKEIRFFHNTLCELAETLIALMDDHERILFIYHPHLRHLKADVNGRYWNTFVSSTVREVADEYDIAFYDATVDLKTQFRGNPENFYWPHNIHFNFEGLKIYGELVAKRIFSLVCSSEEMKMDLCNNFKF